MKSFKWPLSESYEQNIPVALFITIHNIIVAFSPLKEILNPWSPQCDQHKLSRKDNNTLSREMVGRINKMITLQKMLWSFLKFSQLVL